MRLLFVTGAVPPARLGGAESYALQLAEALGERGCDIDVVGWAGGPAEFVRQTEFGSIIGLAGPVHRYFGFLVRATRWLKANAGRYDAVQFFDMNHLAGLGLNATRGVSPCRIARVEGVLSWTNEQLELTRVPLLADASRKLLRQADRYVVVSTSEVDELVREGVDRSLIEYIPNGIDTERFTGTPAAGAPVVVCPARLRPEKNHADLLRAFSMVVRDVPQARLLLPGDGPALDDVRSLVDTLHLGECVSILGHVDDMGALLAESRAVALLSTAEGPALGVLEAAATYRPAVVTRVGGLNDSVRDGETGLAVDVHDIEGAAAALRRLLTDDDLAIRMGAAARRFVEAERSLSVVADRYVKYLQSCVGEDLRDTRSC